MLCRKNLCDRFYIMWQEFLWQFTFHFAEGIDNAFSPGMRGMNLIE